MGNLITGLDFMLQVEMIPITAETAETNFDEFKGNDCVFEADWWKTKGLHKLCSVYPASSWFLLRVGETTARRVCSVLF